MAYPGICADLTHCKHSKQPLFGTINSFMAILSSHYLSQNQIPALRLYKQNLMTVMHIFLLLFYNLLCTVSVFLTFLIFSLAFAKHYLKRNLFCHKFNWAFQESLMNSNPYLKIVSYQALLILVSKARIYHCSKAFSL